MICLKKRGGGRKRRYYKDSARDGKPEARPSVGSMHLEETIKGTLTGRKMTGYTPSSNIQLGYARKACSQAHSGWWLNSAPCSCRPEGPVSLLAFSQGFILAPGGCLKSSCFLCAFSCNRRAPLMSHIFLTLSSSGESSLLFKGSHD